MQSAQELVCSVKKYREASFMYTPEQDFSTSGLLTLWTGYFFAGMGVEGCSMYCRMFNSILDFYPLVASSISYPSCGNPNCLQTLPIFPWRAKGDPGAHPSLWPHASMGRPAPPQVYTHTCVPPVPTGSQPSQGSPQTKSFPY